MAETTGDPELDQRLAALFSAGPHPWLARLPYGDLKEYGLT